MTQPKLLTTVTIAILALTSLLAATASAESNPKLPNILPGGTAEEPILAVSTSGKSTFGFSALESITSQKSVGTLDGTSTKLGTFSVLFSEFTDILGEPCTGTGDAVGTVAVAGTFHIRA